MRIFSKLHPLTLVIYYGIALALLLFFEHPALRGVILMSLILTYCCQAGVRKTTKGISYSLGTAILCVLINPLINHRGVTLLCMMGETRITWEAVFYGANMALFLVTSLYLFFCFSYFMTSEKVMTLLGGIFPSFALLFSMILRLVPRTSKRFQELRYYHGNKPGVWSALISYSMEEAMERSLSMKARGYGKGKRSCFYKRKWKWQNWCLCGIIVCLGAVGLWGYYWTEVKTWFFPSVTISEAPWYLYLIVILYFCIPLLLQGKEEIRWHLSKGKIMNSSIRMQKNRQLS